ncbi:MAG: hypothetical protein PHS74_00360 [Lachnospiraceae bacterium]|nr:hypothetical protein [Lachnospiraceae bacterium]
MYKLNHLETLKLENTQENWQGILADSGKYREQMRVKYPDKILEFSAASLADNAGLELRVYEKLDKYSRNKQAL